MIYYLLSSCIAMLNLGINKPTTLKFDSAIEYVSLGREDSFTVIVSNNKKLLTLKPITAQDSTPLVIVTKNGDFEFQGTTTLDKHYSQFVNVKRGEVSKVFQRAYSNKKVEVLEGDRSLRIVNKSSKPINVNGVETKTEIDTCKGSPLIVNGRALSW